MNGGKGKLFVSMSCFWIFAICILPCHQVWAQLPHPIDLVDVGATVPGFRLEGLDYYDWCGASVSGAGDVNGDGFADMIIGAYGGDPGGNDYAGETYLIYGSASGFGIGGVLDPSTLNGNNGVRLDGIEPGDYFGASVSGAGDVNGDGFADLLIGAQGAGITGGAYLVYGSASGIGSGGLLDVSTLDGANGVRLNGIDQGDGFGSSVSGAGDINGDGFADLLIGASGGDPGGDLDAGETYLVYGSASGIGSGGILDVATLDGNNGVRIDGIDPDDRSGHPVSGAGDINGDGFDDLLIAAHLADPGGANEAGETYLVYGSGSGIGIGGVLDLATLDGFNGVRLDGIDPGDASSGSSVSAAGDLNGDSYADFLIGASNADNGTGEAYLIYGSASGVGSGGALNLASLNGTNGVLFYVDPLFFQGSTAYVGRSVSSAGDVNGDGLADLLVGAPGYPGGLGPTFLVYGSSLEIGSGGALDLALLDGNNGIHLEGGTSGSVGYSVSGAGDVNGDGLTDLLVGAPGGFTGGVTDPGKSYLVLGSGTSTDAFYTTLIRVGDPPRQGIGMIGDWSHSIPMSRVWVDFVSGDNVSGDPSITTVTLQRLPSSSFAPLEVDPQYEWEIETDRVSYGSAAVTFKGSGERGETDWKALILITDDGGVTWYAPQIQLRNSLLHEITLPGESFPAQYALVLATDISAPTVVDAVYNDDDDDGVVEAGESVTLIMSSGVIVRPAQLSQTSFYLPVSGDSLGGAGFSVAANPNNTRQIVITLGTGASLTIAGEFNIANTGAGQPSGIDISDSRLPTAIQSLYGVKAVDGGTPGVNDSGVDILYTLVTNSASVGPGGGTVTVTNSPNAAYIKHSITIPSGALPQSVPKTKSVSAAADVTFTLQPPPVNLGMIGAVQIVASDPNTTFSLPATLTIEYRQSDVDVEMGQTEAAMRVHQLVENPLGVFNWVQLPGTHSVNTETNTVSVQVTNLNPMGSVGSIGIFVNLIGETIEECSYNIAPGSGGAKVVLSFSVPITGGPESIYELHRIEIPGYQLTTPTDPDRIEVTISSARLIDRISTVGGNSFPESSHAIFVIKTNDAYGRPIVFDAAVNMYIEFLDGTLAGLDAFNDVVNFAGERKAAWMMQLVKDVVDGAMVDFQFVEGITQTVTEFPGGGKAEAMGVPNLTGTSGKGVWGAVARDFPTAARNWELYQ